METGFLVHQGHRRADVFQGFGFQRQFIQSTDGRGDLHEVHVLSSLVTIGQALDSALLVKHTVSGVDTNFVTCFDVQSLSFFEQVFCLGRESYVVNKAGQVTNEASFFDHVLRRGVLGFKGLTACVRSGFDHLTCQFFDFVFDAIDFNSVSHLDELFRIDRLVIDVFVVFHGQGRGETGINAVERVIFCNGCLLNQRQSFRHEF